MKEIKKTEQHVQVPNDMTITHKISPKDLLVYATIKRFANKDGIAYPSIKTISDKLGVSTNTVRSSIKVLEMEDYIDIDRSKKVHIYKCKKYDAFEPFSYEFLDKKDLTLTEKAYILASQQYMIKENDEGKISYSTANLARKINMSESTIRRCDKSLEDKNYLSILNLQGRDPETGLATKEKMFHLTKLEQAIVFILKDHDDKINKNTEDIEQLKKENESLRKDLEIIKRNLIKNPTIYKL